MERTPMFRIPNRLGFLFAGGLLAALALTGAAELLSTAGS
jgi:hypothetical protein